MGCQFAALAKDDELMEILRDAIDRLRAALQTAASPPRRPRPDGALMATASPAPVRGLPRLLRG